MPQAGVVAGLSEAEVDALIAVHAALITGVHGLALGARVSNSVGISIPNNAWTALTFDTERYDTDTIHDLVTNPSRLTCKTAGKYIIIGCAAFAANATGERGLEIVLNGITRIVTMSQGLRADNLWFSVASTIWDMAVNDYAEAWVFQNSGGALDCTSYPESAPEFMMARIG